MQKKLIALAVAAAFSAPAFADVTMYGTVDAAVAHASADGQKSGTIAVSGGLSQSRLGVKTAEDLNDGLKAVVVLEYGLDPQTNNTIGSPGVGNAAVARQQMLALAGGFGTVATGYLQTTGYDFAVKFDPTADSLVSPLQSMTTGTHFLIGSAAIASRAQRALAYISPNMGGVTVAVNYSTDTGLNGNGLGNLGVPSTASDAKVGATLASVNYDWNALSVGGVYAKSSAPTGLEALSLTDYALGASYDFTVVKLFGTYQQTKNDTAGAVADKAMSFSAVAPVGPGAVLFSYAKSTIGNSTMTAATTGGVGLGLAAGASANGSGYTVGWLQGLSKTTTAYATLTKVTNGSNSSQYSVINNSLAGGTVGESSTLLAVGLNKKF